jgi:hypothetical protein
MTNGLRQILGRTGRQVILVNRPAEAAPPRMIGHITPRGPVWK